MSDWKVSREELLHLLGAAPAAASAPGQVTGPAPTMPEVSEPNPERVAAELADSKPARMFTSAHFVLARALPRLWRLAQIKTEGADVRTQRRKLRELISWVLAKEGFVVEANATMPYQQEGETVAGRLELLVKARTGAPVLAIETDWIGETSSLLKLEAAHRTGLQAMWILGRPCATDDLPKYRTLANRILQQATGFWLAIYHLEHGWVRARTDPAAPR